VVVRVVGVGVGRGVGVGVGVGVGGGVGRGRGGGGGKSREKVLADAHTRRPQGRAPGGACHLQGCASSRSRSLEGPPTLGQISGAGTQFPSRLAACRPSIRGAASSCPRTSASPRQTAAGLRFAESGSIKAAERGTTPCPFPRSSLPPLSATTTSAPGTPSRSTLVPSTALRAPATRGGQRCCSWRGPWRQDRQRTSSTSRRQ
jgi:hypothetical protein